MKRFLATILALIYLSFSVGANVYRHYCMDRLVAWGLGKEKNTPVGCPYCGMTQNSNTGHCNYQVNGCCHDEHQHVKIDKDQKAVDESFKLVKPVVAIAAYLPLAFVSASVQSPALAYPTTHAPPQTGKISLFVRNCVFRI